MRRAFVVLLLVPLIGAAACSREPREQRDVSSDEPVLTQPPSPSASPSPTPSNFGRFDVDATMEHVRALGAEIGKREAGTPGDELAATYIEEQLIELGWEVTQQEFPLPQGGTSTNVIGVPPDFSTDEPYVIVGGHRDSLNGPGANDNATGVAAALDIARAVTEVPAPLPVMFVAFGAEERQPTQDRPHHIGSVFYVSKMTEAERTNLEIFVNLDMIGHGDEIICGTLATGPRDGTDLCVAEGKKAELAVRERVTPDWSDHGSFQKAGMNIAWLWTGDVECCYHNPADTIDVVRPGDLKKAGGLALRIVRASKTER